MEKQSVFVSAVVYVRNDAGRIARFLRTVGERLDELFAHYEIIVVDDNSSDDSAGIAVSAKEGLRGALSVVRMSFPQGVQRAMNAGVDLAIGDFVFEFETCAVDYPAEMVDQVYFKALEGFDIVSAVPDKRAPFTSRLFYALFNRHSGTQYPLMTDRFRMVSRRAINRVRAMSDNITYRKAFYMGCGLKSENILYTPSVVSDGRRDGKERRNLAIDSMILFTDITFKLSLFMSLFMAAFMVGVGIYAVVIYLLGNPIEGWTTTLLVLSFAFFGIFAVLTIVVKYLSMVLGLVFNKIDYTVESVNKY